MMSKNFFSGVSALLLLVFASSVSMAEVGPWSGTPEGQARILTAGGGPAQDGRYLAGIEIALEPGWKTYWRNPGESGIPTTIDFSASDNLLKASTLYPVPERYEDGYATSLVYHDLVLLPVLLTPRDPALPIRINAQMSYGVCEKVCIPAEASLEAQVGPEQELDSVSTDMIKQVIAGLPRPARPDDVLGVTGISKVETESGSPTLSITARLEDNQATPDLFVVAPEGSYISLPRLVEQSESAASWHLSLNGLSVPEGEAELSFTLVQGDSAIVHNWHLPKTLLD